MIRSRMIILLVLAACLMGLCAGSLALEVECDTTYCFSSEDFSDSDELTGICITGLPEASAGTVLLGSRVLRPGDILTAEQLTQMTFAPLQTEQDIDAVVTYLPIYADRVEKTATMTIMVRGKVDKAPVAEDFALETYKNLSNEGKLKVTDPEGKSMTYSVTRQPKRGTVEIREDGSFVYTPKKNKVGVDSFVYTATDPAGNVSREATVTVQILKPGNSTQYTDTAGEAYRFAAEWLKNSGLFVGEQVGGSLCFNGEKPVSRGEFLTMMVKTLGIPVEKSGEFTGYSDEAPDWLKPYLAAALRSGLTAGLPASETGAFGHSEAIIGGEAAVMLQNAMDFAVATCTMEGVETEMTETWSTAAVATMAENGIDLSAEAVLTRGEVALILYQAHQLAEEAPGLQMYQ